MALKSIKPLKAFSGLHVILEHFQGIQNAWWALKGIFSNEMKDFYGHMKVFRVYRKPWPSKALKGLEGSLSAF